MNAKQNGMSPERNLKVDYELLALCFKQLYLSAVAAFFCATIMFVSLHESKHSALLIVWFVALLVIYVWRLMVSSLFLTDSKKKRSIAFYRNNFIAGAFLSGVMWGIVAVLFFTYVIPIKQILLILVLAGITAGAVASLSGVIEAAFAFLIPAMTPYIIETYLYHQATYTLIYLALFIYLILLSFIVARTHRILKESLYLKYEHEELLEEMAALNKSFEQMAMHDRLTDTDNSRLFEINLKKSLSRARRFQHKMALLYVDIDKFKEVNDTYGHDTGDLLLQIVVNKVKTLLRESDEVARIGGDEFIILADWIIEKEDVNRIADKICKSIAKTVRIHEHDINVSASIGVSFFPENGDDPDLLIKAADSAMYKVKQRGGNNFLFYS